MSATEQSVDDLREALDSALEACRLALVDYRAGLLDADQLRRALFRSGLVQWPDSAWLLDLKGGRWWRYDGVGLGEPYGSEPIDPTMFRLGAVIDELVGDVATATDGGGRS